MSETPHQCEPPHGLQPTAEGTDQRAEHVDAPAFEAARRYVAYKNHEVRSVDYNDAMRLIRERLKRGVRRE